MDYATANNLYNPQKLFKTLELNLNINFIIADGEPKYELNNIELGNDDKFNTSEFKNTKDKLSKKVKLMNKKINLLKSERNNLRESIQIDDFSDTFYLSPFYAIKEIIDEINEDITNKYTLYFRGQSGNWDLVPTIFRNNYKDEYRKNFEEIYKHIARKYPDKLKYVTKKGSDERAQNLAELQHYGLGTPLVDITSNPFIALVFMTNEYNPESDKPNPKLDIFFIKSNGNNYLFQEVKKNENNLRIDAQEGAFLNFEKLFENDEKVKLLNSEDYVYKFSINLICNRKNFTNNKELSSLLPDDYESKGNDNNNNKNDLDLKRVRQIVAQDLRKELNRFHYSEADLFPDFDSYLNLIKTKYSSKSDNNDVKLI